MFQLGRKVGTPSSLQAFARCQLPLMVRQYSAGGPAQSEAFLSYGKRRKWVNYAD